MARVFPITGFHSQRLSLSSSLKKKKTHILYSFLCSQCVSHHLSNLKENRIPEQGADSEGTIGHRKQQLMNGFKWKVVVRV